MPGASEFCFRCLRFTFEAEEPIDFPVGKPANLLRGALGSVLKGNPERYSRIFAPKDIGAGSGYSDSPRPFVFRAAHLDGLRVQEGETFSFNIHLFDLRITSEIESAIETLVKTGLGPRRSRVKVRTLESEEKTVSLLPGSEEVGAVHITFVTPTELKSGGLLASQPDPGVLIARAVERISNLLQLYGGRGSLEVPAVAGIRMTECHVTHQIVKRFSTRTGQTHPLGGFTGDATYEGDLASCFPILTIAQHTGVGRQTTWGKGELRVRPLVVDGRDEIVKRPVGIGSQQNLAAESSEER